MKGGMEGSGEREGTGPMKSVNSTAREVASPPLGERAVATGNAHRKWVICGLVRKLGPQFTLSLVRKSAGPHFTHARRSRRIRQRLSH